MRIGDTWVCTKRSIKHIMKTANTTKCQSWSSHFTQPVTLLLVMYPQELNSYVHTETWGKLRFAYSTDLCTGITHSDPRIRITHMPINWQMVTGLSTQWNLTYLRKDWSIGIRSTIDEPWKHASGRPHVFSICAAKENAIDHILGVSCRRNIQNR